MFKLISCETNKLTKKNILEILKLKDTYWRYGISEQKKFFKKKINKNDIHNLLYIKSDLKGYTCLRKKKYLFKSKKFHFFLFDTLVINKKVRSSGYGSKLMKFNNQIINKHKLLAFLICKNKVKPFYKKFRWSDTKVSLNKKSIMIYPKKKFSKKYNPDNLKNMFISL